MQIPAFLLDEWLNHYHFADTPPEFDLASSTGPRWTTNEILGLMTEEDKERLYQAPLFYSAASGAERLRETLGTIYGVETDQLQIVTGASEALLILLILAAEPGANVILPFPIYPPVAVEAKLLGLETRYYHLRRENNFNIDNDEIKALADDNTKILLVNSPHNPTGAAVSYAELRDLHDFAVLRGIQFVSDEVYHPIYHQGETTSAASLPHATTLGSFSKAFSLSGLRIGWIVDRDPARVQQYTNARSYFTISNAPPSEELGLIALQHRDTILARTRKVTADNLVLLDKFFSEWRDQLGWVRPRGGMICFPWLRNGDDARGFCEAVAARGVLLAPGDCFQMSGHFRLGFGLAETGFGQGLERIASYLTTLPTRKSYLKTHGVQREVKTMTTDASSKGVRP